MRGVARPQRRRLLVPEVVQTSAMDCGPAALKCLLDGFGMPVSYGRLREACQTNVDGTSIDTLEEVAVQLGLEAEQIMRAGRPRAAARGADACQPSSSSASPMATRTSWWRGAAMAASCRSWTRPPGAAGRPADSFSTTLYVHTMPIPAAAWRAWAGSDECLDVLHYRLARLGLSRRTTARLLDAALAGSGMVAPRYPGRGAAHGHRPRARWRATPRSAGSARA